MWPFDPNGAAAYDAFLAGYGLMPADLAASEDMDADRLARLLDRIGPAIVLTHSASGPDGWLVADRRPGLVRAIVSIEPMGPPFADTPGIGALAWVSPRRQSPTTPLGRHLLRCRDRTRRSSACRHSAASDRCGHRRNLSLRSVRTEHRRVLEERGCSSRFPTPSCPWRSRKRTRLDL